LILGAKLVWVGDVEAASEAEAIAKGARKSSSSRKSG
jgi:hypothetical protein